MRAIAWADSEIGEQGTKTLNALLHLGKVYEIVAVIDRQHQGLHAGPLVGLQHAGPPIVASLKHALAFQPETLILSDLPFDQGGTGFSDDIRAIILEALRSGLHVVNTQHFLLQDDREIVDTAAYYQRMLLDLRRSPPRFLCLESSKQFGEQSLTMRRPLVILSAGTDSAVGKMTTAYCLVQHLKAVGISAHFIATGQIGILIGCDEGAAVDHIEGDFMSGAVHMLVETATSRGAEVVVVEGQAALLHPVYGSVALAILQGATPDYVILSFETGRTVRRYFAHLSCPTPEEEWHAIRCLATYSPSPQLLGLSSYGKGLPKELNIDGVLLPVINSQHTMAPLVEPILVTLKK